MKTRTVKYFKRKKRSKKFNLTPITVKLKGIRLNISKEASEIARTLYTNAFMIRKKPKI